MTKDTLHDYFELKEQYDTLQQNFEILMSHRLDELFEDQRAVTLYKQEKQRQKCLTQQKNTEKTVQSAEKN